VRKETYGFLPRHPSLGPSFAIATLPRDHRAIAPAPRERRVGTPPALALGGARDACRGPEGDCRVAIASTSDLHEYADEVAGAARAHALSPLCEARETVAWLAMAQAKDLTIPDVSAKLDHVIGVLVKLTR